MNKKTYYFSICGAAILLVLLSATAWGYEKEIEQLSAAMAEKIAAKGKKTVAVVDFTDLEGNVTQLDRFIAEEFSVALASSGKGFRVIDRTHLKSIIKENKLSATGLIDPATARKLGKIAGVDALVTGTLTPFGDNVRVTVKVLDSDTADIIDAAKGNFAKTQAIEELLATRLTIREAAPGGKGKGSAKAGESLQTVEAGGFVFQLLGCKMANKTVTCSSLMTNTRKDKEIYLYGNRDSRSRLFDHKGNEYGAIGIQVGNSIDKDGIRKNFVSGIPVKSSLSFEGVPSEINGIALFEIETNGGFTAQFRDIPLSK
ncbi:MAG: hypothetical protein D3906_01420 [Candidatus Electrothrix sp. AUS1_2]|nr:hypothetical protein [Candidatus Electrothrix sp. AUS1_2]